MKSRVAGGKGLPGAWSASCTIGWCAARRCAGGRHNISLPLEQWFGLHHIPTIVGFDDIICGQRMAQQTRLWHAHDLLGDAIRLLLVTVARLVDPQLGLERSAILPQPILSPAVSTFTGRAGCTATSTFALQIDAEASQKVGLWLDFELACACSR